MGSILLVEEEFFWKGKVVPLSDLDRYRAAQIVRVISCLWQISQTLLTASVPSKTGKAGLLPISTRFRLSLRASNHYYGLGRERKYISELNSSRSQCFIIRFFCPGLFSLKCVCPEFTAHRGTAMEHVRCHATRGGRWIEQIWVAPVCAVPVSLDLAA